MTFRDLIHNALKTECELPYGIRAGVYTVPVGETGQSQAVEVVGSTRFPDVRRYSYPHAQQILVRGAPRAVGNNHVVMGFGGLFTLDLAAASNPPPAGVLLCDINSNQALFWDAFLQLVEECATAAELCQRFSALPEIMTNISFKRPEYINALDKQKQKLQWIYDEKKYKVVRDLVVAGKVANITLSGLDTDRYALLKKTLEDNGLQVSTLYLSNISEYYKAPQFGYYGEHKRQYSGGNWDKGEVELKSTFWQNQLSLCHDNTLVFNAEYHGAEDMVSSIMSYTKQQIERALQWQQGKDSWVSSL